MNFTKIDYWWPLVVGGVAAPVVLAVLLVLLVKDGGTVTYQWLLWLHLPLFNSHKYEVHFLPGGFTHTVVFQSRHRGYNPGLITTVFALMPYCTIMIAYIINQGLFTPVDWALGIGVSLLPVVAMLTITMTRRRRAMSARAAAA